MRRSAPFLGIALVVAGCGGGVRARTSRSPSESFLARAGAICAARGHAPALAPGELPTLASIATARERTVNELSALAPPSPLTKGYRRLVSLIAREAQLLRRFADSVRDGNDASALATQRALRSNAVSHQALTVGLPGCA